MVENGQTTVLYILRFTHNKL